MSLIKPNMDKLIKRKNIKGLFRAMKKKDPYVRFKAACALHELRNDESISSSLPILKEDEINHVRYEAAISLGLQKDTQAVRPLIEALRYKSQKRRGPRPNQRIRQDFIEALKKRGGGLLQEEAIVDTVIDGKKKTGYIYPEDMIIESIITVGHASLGPVLELLNDENEYMRQKAIFILGEIGNKRVLGRLLEALKDKNKDTKMKAAEAVGKIGDPTAFPCLIECLGDADKDVRTAAKNGLKLMGGSIVDDLMNELQKNDSRVVKECALELLGEIGGNLKEIKPLVDICENLHTHLDISLSRKAREALCKRGDLRFAEWVINDLCNRVITNEEYDSETKLLSNLFGSYASVIVSLLCTIRYTKAVPGHVWYSYDDNPSMNAIMLGFLCERNTQVSSNILHKIGQMYDKEVTFGRDACKSDDCTGKISFEGKRKRAKAELERRGNPPYDPSAYLDKEAWKK